MAVHGEHNLRGYYQEKSLPQNNYIVFQTFKDNFKLRLAQTGTNTLTVANCHFSGS